MTSDFTTYFRALRGRDPFPWQTMLAECAATEPWRDASGARSTWPTAFTLTTPHGIERLSASDRKA